MWYPLLENIADTGKFARHHQENTKIVTLKLLENDQSIMKHMICSFYRLINLK